jgi:hypothetical protein
MRDQERHQSPVPDDPTEEALGWSGLTSNIPAAVLASTAYCKIYKLAKELKRPAALITARWDLHESHGQIAATKC